jgi:hypothetical protein
MNGGKTVRQIAAASLAVVALAAGWALAADPFTPGSSESGTRNPATGSGAAGVADERQKVTEMETLYAAGKYDEVIDAGRNFQRNARDPAAKIDATRLVADSLRKKADWKLAPSAYQKLRDCYEKGSDEYARYDGVCEVLRAAQDGVYLPSASAGSKTIVDDPALADALNCIALARQEKLKSRIPGLARARTVQELVSLFAALIDDFRQARALSPSISAEPEQQAAQAAAQRLAELGRAAVASLTARQADFKQAKATRRLTSTQRKDMENCQSLCDDLARSEAAFQAALDKVGGAAGWADGARLRSDSAARQATYARMAPTFAPPPDPRHTNDRPPRDPGAGRAPRAGP